MASRSSLVVNARVHLPGSRGRSAVITNNIEYVATREGADKSATVDDLRRSELAEKMGLVGYYAERPGSTALFDQNGAVPLRTARRELEKADGAIATVVLSVRRDEACELDLACKEDWQRFCRRNLAPALAEAMGIPESSVRWVAAEHENHPNSKHVHVIAWSSDGSFDSLMARNRLDRARNALTDAALAPALAAEYEARDLARSRAVDAVRHIPADEIGVALPADGRISYAHLRRWHPDVAKAVDVAIAEAGSRHPEIKGAIAAYSKSVERCADLKGLEGVARDRYVNDAMRELRARQGNALLRVIAPDRATAPERELMRSAPASSVKTWREHVKPRASAGLSQRGASDHARPTRFLWQKPRLPRAEPLPKRSRSQRRTPEERRTCQMRSARKPSARSQGRSQPLYRPRSGAMRRASCSTQRKQ